MTVPTAAELLIAGIVALSAPLLFAASGEYVAERAGTLNISVEAMMLAAAYVGTAVATVAGNLLVGMLAGVTAGLAVAAVHANLSHRLAANTFVVGLTLDALVLGITDYFFTAFPQSQIERFSPVHVPGLWRIPVIGPSVFVQPWPLYSLVVIIPAVWWVVERTRWGLEVRACGEDPWAADASGVPVNRRRRQGLYVCGALSGLGGAYLTLCQVGLFNFDATGGIGFIVIAAVIFGGWTLRGAMAGALLFGGTQALRSVLPTAFHVSVSPELLLVLPYVAALAGMVLLGNAHRAPRALAQPFTR